jgi:hypothetical protein
MVQVQHLLPNEALDSIDPYGELATEQSHSVRRGGLEEAWNRATRDSAGQHNDDVFLPIPGRREGRDGEIHEKRTDWDEAWCVKIQLLGSLLSFLLSAGLQLSAGDAAPSVLLHMEGSFTLGTWFKPKRRHSAIQCLASLGQAWALVLRPSGCITFMVLDPMRVPTEHTTVLASPISIWSHVAVTYNARTFEVAIYVNGTRSPVMVNKSKVRAAA